MSTTDTTLRPASAEWLASLNAEQIVTLGRQLCAQLEKDPDACHGDIWPGNIFLDEEGGAHLGSGSLAPVSERVPEQLEYMAPELFWGNEASRAADLYSVGLVLYTAYNHGRLPFIDSDTPEDVDRAQALRSRMKGESFPMPEAAGEEVRAILSRALNYETVGRYAESSDMLRALSETDEALPSTDADGASVDPAAISAAAFGLAGVSAVSTAPSLPVEQVRPAQSAADISATHIVVEEEVDSLGRPAAPASAPADAPTASAEPTAEPEATPEAKSEAAAETTPKAAPAGSPLPRRFEEELRAAPLPGKTPTPEPQKKTKKKTGGIVVIACGLAVIAGLIAVAVRSLGGIDAVRDDLMSPPPTSLPMVETTAEPTDAPEPTVTPEPEPEKKFDLIATDLSWKELTAPRSEGGKALKLAALHDEAGFTALTESADKAGLENIWLGAQYLSAAEAPEGEAGWYWSDEIRLPENSSFWTRGEPAASDGAHLMLCRDENGSWGFCAVTDEDFESNPRQNLGYAVIGSGRIVRATPSPSARPTVTPASRSAGSGSYVPYVAPTAAPAPVPTTAPTTAPTTPPAPTSTPAPTTPPVPYQAERSDKSWSELTELAVVNSGDEFSEIVKFLNAYNESQSDDRFKVQNVWLGAEYLAAADAPDGKTEGWYWTDKSHTPLLSTDSNWAKDEGTFVKGAKLMLRWTEENGWQYYGVTEEAFNTTDYPNSGYLTEEILN